MLKFNFIFVAVFLGVFITTVKCGEQNSDPFYLDTFKRYAVLANNPDFLDASIEKHSEVSRFLHRMLLFEENPVNDFFKLQMETARYQGTLAVSAISTQCKQDLTALILSLVIQRPKWAIEFIDAFAKPPAGLLDGNLNWFGAFDECTSISVDTEAITTTGQYCLVPIDTLLKIGICVPMSCSRDDIASIVSQVNTFAHSNKYYNLTSALNITTEASTIMCNDLNLPKSDYFWVAIAMAVFFTVLNVLSTIYDIVLRVRKTDTGSNARVGDISANTSLYFGNNATSVAVHPHSSEVNVDDDAPLVGDIDRPPMHVDIMKANEEMRQVTEEAERRSNRMDEFLLSFSLLKNIEALFTVEKVTSRTGHTLQALHGIRFITMLWVLLGHTFLLAANSGFDNMLSVLKLLKNIEFQVILHGVYAVDTFLVLGGFLLGYLTLRRLDKIDFSTGGSPTGRMVKFFGKMYLHRYLRLTPVYLLALFVYIGISPYFGNGPTWQQYSDPFCVKGNSWWKNLLYIQNLVDKDKECMFWAWYLAVDFQLFIISPIPLLAFYWRPLAGWIVSLALIAMSAITSGINASNYNFEGAWFQPIVQNISNAAEFDIDNFTEHFLADYFIMPWCRAAPWAIGLTLGCALHRMPPTFTNARLMPRAARAVLVNLRLRYFNYYFPILGFGHCWLVHFYFPRH